MSEHITVSRELIRQVLEGIKRSRSTAMIQTLVARIPESGLFGGIAQDLDFAESKLRAALEQPPQKPKLRVGQIWLTRDGREAKIISVTYHGDRDHPVLAKVDDWYERTYTLGGMFTKAGEEHPDDLIELISDVQKGGET